MIRYQDLTVADVMTPNPVCLSNDLSVAEAEARLLEISSEGAPVVDGAGRFLGVVTLARLTAARHAGSSFVDAIREDAPTCKKEVSFGQACQHLVRARAHRCVVVDEDEHPIGIVTGVDAARVLACLEDLAGKHKQWTFRPMNEGAAH